MFDPMEKQTRQVKELMEKAIITDTQFPMTLRLLCFIFSRSFLKCITFLAHHASHVMPFF